MAQVLPTHSPLGSTHSVGNKGGKPLSHKHVLFFHGSPNIYGSITWEYLGSPKHFSILGFSTAILPQSAFKNLRKKSAAIFPFSYRSTSFIPPFELNSLTAPAAVKYVHGGNAIIISHCIFSNSSASTCKCHSGCPPEHGSISQLYASCPRFRNSIVTVCDSSHATKIFIFPKKPGIPLPRPEAGSFLLSS